MTHTVGCCAKTTMILLTVPVILVGILLVMVSGRIKNYDENDFYVDNVDEDMDKYIKEFIEDHPEVMGYVDYLMYTGVACVLTGALGVLGTLFENLILLTTFFLMVALMFTALLIGYIAIQVKFAEVEAYIRDSMKLVYTLWFDINPSIPNDVALLKPLYIKLMMHPDPELQASIEENIKHVDELLETKPAREVIVENSVTWLVGQEMLKCCGYDGPEDWWTLFEVPPFAAYCQKEAPRETLKHVVMLVEAVVETKIRLVYIKKHFEDIENRETWGTGCGRYLVSVVYFVNTTLLVLLVFLAVLFLETAYIIYLVWMKQKDKRQPGEEVSRVEASIGRVAEAGAHKVRTVAGKLSKKKKPAEGGPAETEIDETETGI